MISDSDKHLLIGAGIDFMRTISNIYGADKGMQLWSTIADTIDPDLKGEVFLAMLTGDFRQDKIVAKQAFDGAITNKVGLVRCLRKYDRRNLGLKQAMDITNQLMDNQHVLLEVDPKIRPTFVVELHKHNIMS